MQPTRPTQICRSPCGSPQGRAGGPPATACSWRPLCRFPSPALDPHSHGATWDHLPSLCPLTPRSLPQSRLLGEPKLKLAELGQGAPWQRPRGTKGRRQTSHILRLDDLRQPGRSPSDGPGKTVTEHPVTPYITTKLRVHGEGWGEGGS